MTDQTPGAAREDEELRLRDGELRMNAYYYVFDRTGVVEVDRILAAVACAGKGCHNTADWSEFDYPKLIQRWADNAAKAFRDAAAVSRSLDAAWRKQIAALKVDLNQETWAPHREEAAAHNAALDALLARMTQQEPTDV